MAEKLEYDEKIKKFETFRKQIIDILKNCEYYKKPAIYNPEEKGFTLAINSRWGTGKTTFLKRLENFINKDLDFKAVYYNAWESDGFGNSFIPIIYKIYELINIDLEALKELIGDSGSSFEKFKEIATLFGHYLKKPLLNGSISFKVGSFGIQTHTKEWKDALDNIKEGKPALFDNSIFEEYQNYTEIKNSFINSLKLFCPQRGKKKVIIIDELDRCRPTYAIETLEVVKHFFDIENVIFIFAVDIEQLSHSIATMYGQNMDSSGYLRRFFDLQINFPQIDLVDFIKMQIPNDLNINSYDNLILGIKQVSENLKLSLRDIEKFTSYLMLLNKTSLRNQVAIRKNDTLLLYYFLIIFNSKYNEFWSFLISGKNRSEQYYEECKGRFYYLAKYLIVEMDPKIISFFCREFLLGNSYALESVGEFKERLGLKEKHFEVFYSLNIYNEHSNNKMKIIDLVLNNLSVIPFDLIE